MTNIFVQTDVITQYTESLLLPGETRSTVSFSREHSPALAFAVSPEGSDDGPSEHYNHFINAPKSGPSHRDSGRAWNVSYTESEF